MTDRTIHVLALIDSLGLGGAEMLLSVFAESAPAAGLRLSVAHLFDVDGNPGAVRLEQRGVQPALVSGTLLHDPRGLARVTRHVARLRPDVVHTHLGYSDLLGAAASRLLNIPSFSTLHVMDWETTGRDIIKLHMMARARRTGNRVIAVSDAARRAYLDKGFDRPDHVVTLRNGTTGTVRQGEGPRVRRELGLKPEHIVVAMVSVLRAGKGHEVAAPAVAALRVRYPELRLLVVGDGPQRAEVEGVLAPLGPAAVLAGQRADILDVLAATDILVHPTRIDALPTALIEAMAASVPSVATAVGGVPELIEDGVNGVLVPPPPDAESFAAALETLVADRDLRRRLGTEGRERYEREFTAARWVESHRELYLQTLRHGTVQRNPGFRRG